MVAGSKEGVAVVSAGPWQVASHCTGGGVGPNKPSTGGRGRGGRQEGKALMTCLYESCPYTFIYIKFHKEIIHFQPSSTDIVKMFKEPFCNKQRNLNKVGFFKKEKLKL